VAQAFIKSATVMGNTVHNAVVKTFAEGMFPGCVGPCYIQPDQMQYVPLEVSMAATLSAQNSQAGTSNSQASPQVTTTTASAVAADPIYSTTPPIVTSVQDGSASVFPKGWNPTTGYGMHLDFFATPPKMQFNASASQPMTPQPDPSATQPRGTQQDASAMQPNAQGTWSPQMAAQVNASAPPPMTPQQRLTIMLPPQSPTEILLSQSPHQKGVNWVFHDQATGQLRYVNVPYMDTTG